MSRKKRGKRTQAKKKATKVVAGSGNGAKFNLREILVALGTVGECLNPSLDNEWSNAERAWLQWLKLKDSLESLRVVQNTSTQQFPWINSFVPSTKVPSTKDSSDRVTRLKVLQKWHESKSNTGSTTTEQPFTFKSTKEGCGIIATRDIEKNEEVLRVPRGVMMSESTAKSEHSRLSPLLKEIPFLTKAPTLLLALQLLSECFAVASNPPSPWAAYCASLPPPSSLNIPIIWDSSRIILDSSQNMSDKEKVRLDIDYATFNMEFLRGTSAFLAALRSWRSAARHYHSLYQCLVRKSIKQNPLPLELFTWDAFRWAMSIVITRQNKVPIQKDTKQFKISTEDSSVGFIGELALIPIFDMCNHECGTVTTDYVWNDCQREDDKNIVKQCEKNTFTEKCMKKKKKKSLIR